MKIDFRQTALRDLNKLAIWRKGLHMFVSSTCSMRKMCTEALRRSTWIFSIQLHQYRSRSCPNQEAVPELAEYSRGEGGMGSRGAACSGRGNGCPDMLGKVSIQKQRDAWPIIILEDMPSAEQFVVSRPSRRKREHQLKSRRARLERNPSLFCFSSFCFF